MCGRGACSLNPDALKRILKIQQFLNSDQYYPSYNICPNNFVPVMLLQSAMLKYYNEINQQTAECKEENDKTPQILNSFRWGLVPSFSKDGKTQFKTINARKENVKKSALYRRLVNKKRCVVVMDGYYEWKTTKNAQNKTTKQPYFFTPTYNTQNEKGHKEDNNDEKPLMYMAALWDSWHPPNDPKNVLFTVSIITTDSSNDVSFCHHRMPLLMTKECVGKWLDVNTYSIDDCFKEIDASQKFISIKNHAVPREIVGNTKKKGIECIQTMEEYEAKKKKSGIFKFFKSAKTKKEITSKKDKVNVDESEKMSGKKRKIEEIDGRNKPTKESTKRQKLNNGDAENVDDKR